MHTFFDPEFQKNTVLVPLWLYIGNRNFAFPPSPNRPMKKGKISSAQEEGEPGRKRGLGGRITSKISLYSISPVGTALSRDRLQFPLFDGFQGVS